MDLEKVLDKLQKTVDGLATDVRSSSFAQDKLTQEIAVRFEAVSKRFDSIDEQLVIHREQFRLLGAKGDEVASRVVQIDKRLMVVEAQLSVLENGLSGLNDEASQIRIELNGLNERPQIEVNLTGRVDEIDTRLFQLEAKLST